MEDSFVKESQETAEYVQDEVVSVITCAVDTLLEQSEEDLQRWFRDKSASEREEFFASIWDRIREHRLYGGQPRSERSTTGVGLARAALFLASQHDDEQLSVEASLMMAYTLNANEQYAESIDYYRRGIEGLDCFQQSGRAARLRLGYLHTLSMLGRYDEAIAVGSQAREWFLANNDEEGFARLCVNLGHIYQRLDQHAHCLEYYEKATEYFKRTNNQQGLAQVSLNAGNALAWLDRFEEAEQSYSVSEQLGDSLGIVDLAAQARFNRAYLYFRRGRHMQALEHYGNLRTVFKQNASDRHAALCDLDESEIYLQLSLPNEAARLARRAAEAFERLSMRYEQAKATAFLAIALTQNRQFGDALEVFPKSQSLFEKENNEYWVALVTLYRAEVLYAVGRLWESRALAVCAEKKFAALRMPSKRVVCVMLMGRIALDLNDKSQAAGHAQAVLDWTTGNPNPLLLFPCYAFCGFVSEGSGNTSQALGYYHLATREIENRRTHLDYDDLRVPFYPGKQGVYESLARLTLDQRPEEVSEEINVAEAYAWCERAKSAGMLDLVAHHLPSIRSQGDQALLARIGRIRDELNSSYLRLRSDKAEMPSVTSTSSALQFKEGELLRSIRELSHIDPDYASLQGSSFTGLAEIQPVLPADTTLVEFFIIGDEILGFVVTRERANIFRRLAPVGRIHYLEEQLRNHFLKMPAAGAGNQRRDFADSRLRELYNCLMLPLEHELQTPNLIIVPHGVMHFVPFAALFDGKQYLLDRFTITSSPSASLLISSLKRDTISAGRSFIVGRPGLPTDPEFDALRAAVPEAEWCTGHDFTHDHLMKGFPNSDFLHISTDVEVRHENPMFSSIRCSDAWATAIDLYSTPCKANLVTLNRNVHKNLVRTSDSRPAITEALLYAGARSVLTNLWNVDLNTTGLFMQTFYTEWKNGAAKCDAVRSAALALRNTHAHPFFWAPYILAGQR